MNLADRELVTFLDSQFFTQDEIQAADHPALGAVRVELRAQGAPADTMANGKPTSVLVAGVERRCCVATAPMPRQGGPMAWTGSAFPCHCRSLSSG